MQMVSIKQTGKIATENAFNVCLCIFEALKNIIITHTHAHKDTHRLCNPSLHMLQIQMKTMATDQRGFSRWDGKVKTGNECLNISVAS